MSLDGEPGYVAIMRVLVLALVHCAEALPSTDVTLQSGRTASPTRLVKLFFGALPFGRGVGRTTAVRIIDDPAQSVAIAPNSGGGRSVVPTHLPHVSRLQVLAGT